VEEWVNADEGIAVSPVGGDFIDAVMNPD
jgi:hypothetical protein